jgi:uncharacterized protein (DUF305 family)
MHSSALLPAAALLVALQTTPVSAQTSQPDPHHPAATATEGSTAPAAPVAPTPTTPVPTPGMSAAGPGSGGMMSPDMARMMQGMVKNMCAMMMGDPGTGMMGDRAGGPMAVDGPADPVAGAFAAINRRMHRDMAVEAAGDPDRAFATTMIAHHQGAIDMAKVILAFGADPDIRGLAEQVIKAQEQEITFLNQWLAKRP